MLNSFLNRITSSIPSIPFLSISASLQRNILSFLLKRTLGHLLKGGQLDSSQIDAGIAGGRIELRGVELDPQAVKSHLPPTIPIDFISGIIGTISIQLPFPNFWSGDLNVKISNLDLHVCLKDKGKGKERERESNDDEDHDDQNEKEVADDLKASILSAADEVLKSKEGLELENSILNETTSSSYSSSSSITSLDQNEKVTIISSIVESLLQRLKIQIFALRIKTSNQKDKSNTSEDLEIKIDEILFDANSSSTSTSTSSSSNTSSEENELDSQPQLFEVKETFRNLRISGISLWMSDPVRNHSKDDVRKRSLNRKEELRERNRSNSNSSTSSSSDSKSDTSSESDSDRDGKANYLEMSSAIQDLRESRVGLEMNQSIDSDAMYHSAIDLEPVEMGDEKKVEDIGDESRVRQSSAIHSDSNSNQKRDRIDESNLEESQEHPNQVRKLNLILSFGEEPLMIKLKTSKSIPTNQNQNQNQNSSQTSSSFDLHNTSTFDSNEIRESNNSLTSNPNSSSSKPSTSTNLSITIPTISIFLDAFQISSLISFANSLKSDQSLKPEKKKKKKEQSPSNRISNTNKRSSKALNPFELSVRISSIHTILVYHLTSSSYDSKTLGIERNLFFDGFENHQPKIGHFRIRVDSIQSNYLTDGISRSLEVKIKDFGVFECLELKLIESLRMKNRREKEETISNVLPLLIFDDLLKDYESIQISDHLFNLDSIDWRVGESASFGSYQKTDLSNLGWKLKPRNLENSSKQSYHSSIKSEMKEKIQDSNSTNVISIKINFKDFNEENFEGDIKSVDIKLKAFHLFLDLSVMKRVLPFLQLVDRSLERGSLNEEEEEVDDEISTPNYSKQRNPTKVNLSSSVSTILGERNDEKSHESYSRRANAKSSSSNESSSDSSMEISLDCDLIRLEARVPSKSFREKKETNLNRSEDLNTKISDYLGLDLRSGILILDFKSLKMISGSKMMKSRDGIGFFKTTSGVRFGSDTPEEHSNLKQSLQDVEVFNLEIREIQTFLKPVQSNQAKGLAVMGPISSSLSDEDSFPTSGNSPRNDDDLGSRGDEETTHPLLPRFSIMRKSTDKATTNNAASTSLSIPSIKLNLTKPILDSLFFLIDDISTFSAISTEGFEGWREDENGILMEVFNSNLKEVAIENLLGSQILKEELKHSLLNYDSDETEKNEDGGNFRGERKDGFELVVEEIELVIEIQNQDLKKDKSHEIALISRDLILNGKELNLKLNPTKKPSDLKSFEKSGQMNETLINIILSSLSIKEELNIENQDKIKRNMFGRTFIPSLTNRNLSPMISIQFTSSSNIETGHKESRIEIDLRSFTLFLTEKFDLILDLQRFLKSPEGAFENVQPNELTRLSLKIKDGSVFLSPPNVTSRVTLVISRFLLRVKLMPESKKTTIHYACADVGLFVIDKEEPEIAESKVSRSAREYWTSLGFARLLNLEESKGSISFSSSALPEIDVKISRVGLRLMACADTLLAVTELFKDLSDSINQDKNRERSNSDSSTSDLQESSIFSNLDRSDPMLISIEENAFKRPSSMTSSVPDLLEDDIPKNLAFLGTRIEPDVIETPLDSSEFFGDHESVTSISTALPSNGPDNVMLSTETVTVRLLDPAGIRPKPLYFVDSKLKPQSTDPFSSSTSTIKVRISDCDMSVGLFGGYDWLSTRQGIEEEARKVRRRLQKIKQLVAEGQTPDDSVEEATSNLFESIHISLPQDTRDMKAGDVIKVMDEELDGDQSETSSSASTWQQPLPHSHGFNSSSISSGQRRKRSKIQRSNGSMLDIEVKGSEIEFDSFDESHSLSSRIGFSASTLEILDNLKTSTWRTFLTSMPPEGPAYSRDSDAKMVKVEIREIRPEKGKPRLETRMRSKIEALRLHVDQDALDFLKKFFAFKPPGTSNPPSTLPSDQSSKDTSPFIQHAEIFPIRLKLDYKPKRVNYNLLREGKTIELMNFFHFDGAEMTLRHVTLRGINGWPRLFDTLNDIWTPDIKANQLADVLSGVAPIRSLVNVGAGVADLVLLPIEQYQKDGRLLRGVQKGANSFAKNTMLEAVKLGARLATGTQVVLEKAEHVLGGRIENQVQAETLGRFPTSSNSSGSSSSRRGKLNSNEEHDFDSTREIELDEETLKEVISKYADQPEDMTEALNQAYKGLSKGFSSAAQTILAVPMEVYERGGGEGGAHPVIRAVPIAVLRGAMGASEAVSKTLMGVRNSLDPNAQNENEGKYKHR